MLLTISLIRRRLSEIASATIRKVKQDGVFSFLKAATNRIRYISTILFFKILFGSITRDEMIQQARQNGRYWEYGSSEKIKIQNQGNGTVPNLFTEYSGCYEVKRPFVCELSGGYLINSTDPIVLTHNREVVMEVEKPIFGPRRDATQADTPFHKRTEYSERTASSRMRQLSRGYIQSHSWFHEQTRFETAIPLFRRDVSYYHWLLDQLPAIRGLRRYKDATGCDPTIVTEPDPPRWVQETLSLVGVNNAVPFDAPTAKTDRLVVPSHREGVPRNQSVYEPSREDINWLNREMKSRAPPTSTEYPDRIYISRENFSDRGRYVSNRKELTRVLEEFGIEVYAPETLSIADQIRLYENADLLMGPHGAGLTNMIFSNHTCVIEFLNIPYPSYQHLAQLCGHEYQFLQCEGGSDHHTPIEVGVTELRDLLASVDETTLSTT